MFGIKPKKTGLFGKPWEASSTAPTMNPGMNTGLTPPEHPKQGLGTRLLGQGWEDKAFALGGIMQGDPRGAMMMQQQKTMQQQSLADQAAEQRKRAAEWSDWQRKYDYERQNPKPDAGTSLQRNVEWLRGQGRDKEADDLIARSTAAIDWIQVQDPVTKAVTIVPRPLNGAPAVGGELPKFTADDWESGTPVGGSGGDAAGGFR